MKKQLFNVLLCSLLVVPFVGIKAQTIDEGQSTEGKDFWVTFMQADQDPNNALTLSLSISSREDCQFVKISNPFTGWDTTLLDVKANQMKLVELYTGNVLVANARSVMASTGKVCYAANSEQVDTCALQVTSDKNISLFATNYKRATFDATNVLPTASLKDEYMIQTFTPSDHGNSETDKGKTQGSHFAIIAAEDNTIVDYCPTVPTQMANDSIKAATDKAGFIGEEGLTDREKYWLHYTVGDTLHSPVLMKGQVYYVWTGKQDNEPGDLSGTFVKARDGKKIAVFQGCPHTNIPYQTKERDHIFSQAMPTKYWGNTFVLTTSAGRKIDYVRIMALNDGTEVRINGTLVHTFNFASDKKHYWQFTIGQNGSYAKDGSCVVTTSCACATHLFLASKKADNVDDGDPAMLWVNPIEQQIDQVTFATYSSKNGTTKHNVNVVTDKPNLMFLDGDSAYSSFKPVSGSSTYYYAQISLGNTAASHTLRSNGSNFIAHVYGFTSNESYGYSAGGATKSLSQAITISTEDTSYVLSPDKENNLCGKDTIRFACKPNFMPDSIKWHFGDGSADVMVYDTTTVVPHYYSGTQDYNASCTIYRSSSNLCVGQSAETVINILVTVGRYSFSIGEANIPCPVNGVQGPGTIPYTSSINLQGNNVKVDFDAAAKADGFKKSDLTIKPTYFELNIPSTAKPGVKYGIQIDIDSDCGDTTAILPFALPVGNDVIAQRYNNVLGLLKDHPQLQGLNLSDFQWYRLSDSTALAGQVTSNLNMYDLSEDVYKNDEFYVCYWINKGQADAYYNCACSKPFITDGTQHQFATSPDSLIITATYSFKQGEKVFVNANWGGKTDIECYAQWITTDGRIYKDMKFNIPNGGCTIDTPAEPGLYMLRVVTDKKTRSFKFIIQ